MLQEVKYNLHKHHMLLSVVQRNLRGKNTWSRLSLFTTFMNNKVLSLSCHSGKCTSIVNTAVLISFCLTTFSLSLHLLWSQTCATHNRTWLENWKSSSFVDWMWESVAFRIYSFTGFIRLPNSNNVTLMVYHRKQICMYV